MRGATQGPIVAYPQGQCGTNLAQQVARRRTNPVALFNEGPCALSRRELNEPLLKDLMQRVFSRVTWAPSCARGIRARQGP